MYKFLSFIFLFVFSSTSFTQEIDYKFHTNCLHPTVMILNADGKSGGTGFIIRSTKHENKYRNAFITAHHVVEADSSYILNWIKYKDWSNFDKEKQYPVFICYKSEKNDLAIGVFESDEKLPVVQLDFDHNLYIGTKVMRVGFGLMDDARIDHGIVTQPKTHRPESFSGTIRTNVYSVFGDSGGPLFFDYKVVGICRAVRNYKDQIMTKQSYFTDIKQLKIWDDETDNCISQLYIDDKSLPVLPYVKLQLQRYKYSIPK